MTRFASVVLAAGSGKRMKADVPKQFLELHGKPLIFYAANTFQNNERIDDMIMVTGQADIPYVKEQIVEKFAFSKVRDVVAGGRERYHSVYEGLKALKALGYGQGDYVLINDGARPFIDDDIIGRVCDDTVTYGAVVAGMPSKDTVKLADREQFAVDTPDRSLVWIIQTPQAFEFPLIYNAYRDMLAEEEKHPGITDDAMVVETMTSHKVHLTEGSYKNIKVTTPEDMLIADIFEKTQKSC